MGLQLVVDGLPQQLYGLIVGINLAACGLGVKGLEEDGIGFQHLALVCIEIDLVGHGFGFLRFVFVA